MAGFIFPIVSAFTTAYDVTRRLRGANRAAPGAGTPASATGIDPLIKGQTDIRDYAFGEAKKNFPAVGEALAGPSRYFSRIMSGDRTAMADVLAPELESSAAGYDTAKRNIAETAPRGGGRTAAVANLNVSKASDASRIIQGARPGAAQGLMTISQILSNLATGQLGGAIGAGGSAIQGELGKMQAEIARRGQGIGVFSSLGRGLAGIFGPLIRNRLGGLGGGGAGSIAGAVGDRPFNPSTPYFGGMPPF